jgi:hypothetical protein
MSRSAKRALLVHWISQKKQAERERNAAKEELATWFKRARFALDKGEVELARAAKERALDARNAMDGASARLVEILTELDRVRAEPEESLDVLAAKARAAHTAESFRALGIDPKFAALEEAGYGHGLDALLDANPETADATGATTGVEDDVWAEADALLDAPIESTTAPQLENPEDET